MEAAAEKPFVNVEDKEDATLAMLPYLPSVNNTAAPVLPLAETLVPVPAVLPKDLSLLPGSGGFLPCSNALPFPVQGTLPMACAPAVAVPVPATSVPPPIGGVQETMPLACAPAVAVPAASLCPPAGGVQAPFPVPCVPAVAVPAASVCTPVGVQGTMPVACAPAVAVPGVPATSVCAPVGGAQGPICPAAPAANMVPSVPVFPMLMACAPAVEPPGGDPNVIASSVPVAPLPLAVAPGPLGAGSGCGVPPIVQNIPQSLPPPAPAGPRKPRQPPFGQLHHFHPDTASTGYLSKDARRFTKEQFKGRLSVTTEDQVHYQGVMRYVVRFSGGEVSSADGVGFIFSPRLPCSKNIQRIVSIFANRTGRICTRAHAEVIRSDIGVKELEIGDWVEVTVDLDQQMAEFAVWPKNGGWPSTASVNFGNMLATLQRKIPNLPQDTCGYFACVVKHLGVSVELGS